MSDSRAFRVYTRSESNPLGDKEINRGKSVVAYEARFWFSNKYAYDVSFTTDGEITFWNEVSGSRPIPSPSSLEQLENLAKDMNYLCEQIKKTLAAEKL